MEAAKFRLFLRAAQSIRGGEGARSLISTIALIIRDRCCVKCVFTVLVFAHLQLFIKVGPPTLSSSTKLTL